MVDWADSAASWLPSRVPSAGEKADTRAAYSHFFLRQSGMAVGEKCELPWGPIVGRFCSPAAWHV